MAEYDIEFLKRKEKEMEECDHLFLKLREGKEYCGFHSSDYELDPPVVVCLHCGLTNKFIEDEGLDRRLYMQYSIPYTKSDYVKINDKVFKKQFNHGYRRGGKSFDERVFNVISRKALYTDHPIMLYKIAKIINENADKNELFQIMITIQTLIRENNYQIQTMDDIDQVIEDYNSRKVKVLKK